MLKWLIYVYLAIQLHGQKECGGSLNQWTRNTQSRSEVTSFRGKQLEVTVEFLGTDFAEPNKGDVDNSRVDHACSAQHFLRA